MNLVSQAFSREYLSDWCQLLSELAKARYAAGLPTLLMNSDVAWQLTGSDPKQNIRLWFNDGEIVAYAWFQPPLSLIFDGRPEVLSAALPELMNWAGERRRQFEPGTMPFLNVQDMTEWAEVLQDIERYAGHDRHVMVTHVFEHDTALVDQIVDMGWQATPHFEPHFYHALQADLDNKTNGQAVSVPKGRYEEYAAAHRLAWGEGSSFSVTTLDNISKVGDIFDPDLCMALEVDGKYVATTIFWRDDVAGVGNIEPFGVTPTYRGQGAGAALIAGGLAELKRRGMAACRLYTTGFNHQAQKLYRGCGFQDVGVSRTYQLAL